MPIRDSGAPVVAAVIESSLQHVDAMQAQLLSLSVPLAPEVPGKKTRSPAVGEPFWAAKSNADDLNALVDGIAELNVQLGCVRGSRTDLERATGLAELVRDQLAARRASQLGDAELVRVRTLLEDLRSALASAERAIATSVEQATRELGQVRDASERLRLVPADSRRRAPILVIDDSLTTRMLEQSILESAGYEVDLAVSGEDGMDKARLRKYALSTGAISDHFQISVTDTGTGIADDVLDKILDPFFTTKPVGQGIGLGLSITYSIVRKHGGTLEFRHAVGGGTEANIRIPMPERRLEGSAVPG